MRNSCLLEVSGRECSTTVLHATRLSPRPNAMPLTWAEAPAPDSITLVLSTKERVPGAMSVRRKRLSSAHSATVVPTMSAEESSPSKECNRLQRGRLFPPISRQDARGRIIRRHSVSPRKRKAPLFQYYVVTAVITSLARSSAACGIVIFLSGVDTGGPYTTIRVPCRDNRRLVSLSDAKMVCLLNLSPDTVFFRSASTSRPITTAASG